MVTCMARVMPLDEDGGAVAVKDDSMQFLAEPRVFHKLATKSPGPGAPLLKVLCETRPDLAPDILEVGDLLQATPSVYPPSSEYKAMSSIVCRNMISHT